MKALKVLACVAALTVGGMLSWQAVAQEAPAKPVAKSDPRGPLPAQFGKLGISDEVKDELYKIHEEYDVQIQTLTAQIKKLQAEKTAKMEVKLTPAQKTRLTELRAEAAAKRVQAEKLKAVEKKPAAAVTPAVPKKAE
jgi:hypothetical protein